MSPLDEYSDAEMAALYDLQYAGWTDDLPLYESFAQRGELPSLELMVGTGRVALHLARNGHRVVGIDNSLPMLTRLEAQLDRKTAQRIRLVEADVRDFDLGGEKFDLVYCALCSLELLHAPADQIATLRCVAKHLAPGGVFVAEIRSLTAIDWSQEPSALRHEWTRTDPATGERITKLHSATSSRSRQMTLDTLIFDRLANDGAVRRRVLDVALRAYGRYEFELLLKEAGLRIANIYGAPDLSPYDDSSDTLFVVAELAQPHR
jgi:SAM-dependent methyltransferase